MKKVFLALLVLLLFSFPTFAKTKTPKKKKAVAPHTFALKQHALVRGPVAIVKSVVYGILFGTEVPVDGLHAGFLAVDHFDDVVHLDKVPGLNVFYAGISTANADFARLDTGIETLEMDLFHKHN